MKKSQITGLVPAVFTPMYEDGRLNLNQIGPIVEQLIREQVRGFFVCGTTGEGLSLSSEERRSIAAAYVEAAAGRLPVIIQVGHNSLAEARALAAHAQQIGADAIAATPPSYFKPPTIEILIRCLAEITAGAPELPFYYYHIPGMTGVSVDLVQLLSLSSKRLPTLVGLKCTTSTVYDLQACTGLEEGRFNLLFGSDEMLLSGLCAGADGAVGSTYNFAAPLYRRIIDAFEQSNLAEAQRYQARSVQMIRLIGRYGGQPASKATMKLIGLNCGPSRLPLTNLSPEKLAAFENDLKMIGFFDWARADVSS